MAIWKDHPTLDGLRAAQDLGMTRHLGIRFTELGADFLRATMPVTAELLQPWGLLHGGASIVLAETLGSTAAYLLIDRERFICVGQEINANHLRPALPGSVITGTARPIHIGVRSQVWGIEMRDERDRLTCISRLTMAVIDRPAALTAA